MWGPAVASAQVIDCRCGNRAARTPHSDSLGNCVGRWSAGHVTRPRQRRPGFLYGFPYGFPSRRVYWFPRGRLSRLSDFCEDRIIHRAPRRPGSYPGSCTAGYRCTVPVIPRSSLLVPNPKMLSIMASTSVIQVSRSSPRCRTQSTTLSLRTVYLDGQLQIPCAGVSC